MKLSQKRRDAIYAAVHEEIMNARIAVAKLLSPHSSLAGSVDDVLSRAQNRAGIAAIQAAGEYMK
jgi:hypothetical protein